VSELCGVKAYVLRYWEQEFTQLKPMKRRGNRRYYQHHEVLLIRRIRDLLYEQGFTISGARNQLTDAGGSAAQVHANGKASARDADEAFDPDELDDQLIGDAPARKMPAGRTSAVASATTSARTAAASASASPVAPAALRDPGTRSRAGDIAELDDDALEAMARDDLALIDRAQRGVGEFANAAVQARGHAGGGAGAGLQAGNAGNAGVRTAALVSRRAPVASASAHASGEMSTPQEIRAELLAIRAMLVS
jgi:DNA-binding transcriptional MerR regulator